MEYCRRVDAVTAIPWVILSEGADLVDFGRQVEIAGKAGACGYMVGRTVWKEAVRISDREHRHEYLRTEAVGRLRRLADAARANAWPWQAKYTA